MTIDKLHQWGAKLTLFALLLICLQPELIHAEYVKDHKMVSLTPSEEKFINQHPEITLAGGLSFEPFLINNLKNNVTGLDVDIAKLITQSTGLKINFELGVWGDIQKKAKKRELDGLSSAVMDEQRANFFNSTIPYMQLSTFVIVRHNNPKNIHSLNDLNGKHIALQKGNKLFDGVLGLIDVDVKIIYFDSIHEVLKAVAAGQADFTVLDESTPYILQKLGLTSSIDMGFPVKTSTELMFLLRNDWPELTSIINKGLATITEKQKKEIRKRWFKPMGKQVNYSLFLKLLIGMLLIIAIILYWNYSLQRARQETQEALTRLKETDNELKKKNTLLEQLSVTDHLTGLYNRVKLDETLEQEINRAERYQETFGVIMLDIDLFKQVNDEFGHQAGDKVLIELANILKDFSREVDVVGRWGGEEFLVILPNTNKNGLIKLAEKLRQAIDNYEFSIIKSKTASFGITVFHKGDLGQTIISRSDEALYLAKENGRNRVEYKW
jgi:diguanylate cyclase (GGDEF)-like protein